MNTHGLRLCLSRNVSLLFAAMTLIPLLSFGQTEVERQRPSMSVHDALTLAEKYIVEQKIDVSKHFLSEVRYQESGSWTNSSLGKGPYWQVTYELVQRGNGGQHFILVYMDGKIGHIRGL